MEEMFPTLLERANVGPRVHRVFSTAGLVVVGLIMLAILATGEGEMGVRFGRALGKGAVLLVFAGGYFCWALVQRPTKNAVWAALVSDQIARVRGKHEGIYVKVIVETKGGETLSIECQKPEEMHAILEEFRTAGTVEVAEV